MRIFTIASGKGGVGKTTLSANIGVALAQNGARVVLFDADLGLADLDVMLGVKSEVNLQHAIDGVMSLRDVMVEGPCGVKIVTGSSGIAKMIRLSRKRLEAFLSQITELEKDTDFLIFDAAAGADAKVMTFLRAADHALLVATPDPASITDVYATAKILFRTKPDADVSLIVNMAENEEQARNVFQAVQTVTQKFLKKRLHYAGQVRFDLRAAQVVRRRKVYVETDPRCAASCDVRTLAGRLCSAQDCVGVESLSQRLQSAFEFEADAAAAA